MKLSVLIFGVLAAGAMSRGVEHSPLISALQPLVYYAPSNEVHSRQKSGLGLLGAGALALGIGAGIIGTKALRAGFVGGALASGALHGHGRSCGGYGGYYDGGYYGSGYGNGYGSGYGHGYEGYGGYGGYGTYGGYGGYGSGYGNYYPSSGYVVSD